MNTTLNQVREYLLKRKKTLENDLWNDEMGGGRGLGILTLREVTDALAVIDGVQRLEGAPQTKTYFIRFWHPELRALWAKEFPEFPLSTAEDSSIALTKEQLGDIAQRCLDLKLVFGAGYGDCIFIARNFFKTT